jgi:acyl-CoA synthetase (AMP-forming)/AMP-acid ligase II
VAVGYFNQPDLTNETFRPDGWQVTQDLGTFDDDGYLRIAGRKRDIIIRGGLNVSPREVEELLLRLPDVKDAAVVGVPDARYGERIYAFIVPTGKATPSVEEITVAFGAMGVAKYKHPERIESIAELPLTATGKVRHQALRDQLGEAAT